MSVSLSTMTIKTVNKSATFLFDLHKVYGKTTYLTENPT